MFGSKCEQLGQLKANKTSSRRAYVQLSKLSHKQTPRKLDSTVTQRHRILKFISNSTANPTTVCSNPSPSNNVHSPPAPSPHSTLNNSPNATRRHSYVHHCNNILRFITTIIEQPQIPTTRQEFVGTSIFLFTNQFEQMYEHPRRLTVLKSTTGNRRVITNVNDNLDSNRHFHNCNHHMDSHDK